MINKIFNEDCLECMKRIPDGSIDLTVTSPPYDNLRTYNWYSWDFEWIANELFRVTKKWWVVVWIVWDSTVKWSKTLSSFKQAIYFKEECWFNLYDNILYSKSWWLLPHKWRYRNCYENMFILSKWKPNKTNLIKDRPNKYAWTNTWNRTIRERDWSLTEKGNKNIPDYWVRYNIWEYSNGKNQWTTDDIYWHPATFPEKLAEDHILSWSNPWDIVLDPFAWSGTTLKMAKKNWRDYIWIEISKEYCNIAQERITKHLCI